MQPLFGYWWIQCSGIHADNEYGCMTYLSRKHMDHCIDTLPLPQKVRQQTINGHTNK